MTKFLLLMAVATLFALAGERYWFNRQLSDARALLRQYQAENAIECLQSIVWRRPNCAEAELLLAAACRRAGKLDEVDSHLSRAAKLGWNARDLDRQRCLTLFQVGDLRRAGLELRQLLMEDATDDEADETYEAMARGYTAAMLLEQAKFILDGWIRWRPNNARAWLMLADVATLGGDQIGEESACRKLLNFAPENREARLRLAGVLMRNAESREAHELLSELHHGRPRDPDVLLALAEWHHRHAQDGQAKQLLTAALEYQQEPRRRAAILTLLGTIATTEKEHAAASRYLTEASSADPANVATYYALSQSLLLAGRADEAKTYLERYQELQRLEDELHDLRSEVLQHPEDADLRVRAGEILIEMGEKTAGINWLFSAFFYNASHQRAHRVLAKHYEHEGELELAKKHRAVAEGKLRFVGAPLGLPASEAE